MTLSEAMARLRERANATITGDEVRALARAVYGKAGPREVARLWQQARYQRFATVRNGQAALEPGYLSLLRRDFAGPLALDGVDLSAGPDVVAVEDGDGQWYAVPQGAVMRLNHWLGQQMTPAAEPEPPAKNPG